MVLFVSKHAIRAKVRDGNRASSTGMITWRCCCLLATRRTAHYCDTDYRWAQSPALVRCPNAVGVPTLAQRRWHQHSCSGFWAVGSRCLSVLCTATLVPIRCPNALWVHTLARRRCIDSSDGDSIQGTPLKGKTQKSWKIENKWISDGMDNPEKLENICFNGQINF